MKVSCNIIRDLLPLYAEDMVSEDSKKMVDEHLCECDPCTKQLAIMKKAAQVPIEVNVNSLQRIGNTLHRQRVLIVCTIFLTLVTIIVSAISFLNVPVALTAEEAQVQIELMDDGGLKISHVPIVPGEHSSQHGDNMGMILYTDRKTYLMNSWIEAKEKESGKEVPVQWSYYTYGTAATEDGYHIPYFPDMGYPDQVTDVQWYKDLNYWYVNPQTGMAEVLLYDAGHEPPTGQLMQTDSLLWAVFLIAAAAAVGFYGLSWMLKKSWLKELIQRFSILGASIAFSILFLTGGAFTKATVSREPYETLEYALLMSVFLTLTVLFFLRLRKLNKLDKGE